MLLVFILLGLKVFPDVCQNFPTSYKAAVEEAEDEEGYVVVIVVVVVLVVAVLVAVVAVVLVASIKMLMEC